MPIVDKTTFPRLIIQIPEAEFPDEITIVMQGRNIPRDQDANTAQLTAQAQQALAAAGTLGIGPGAIPIAPVAIYSKTWDKSVFSKVIKNKKTAELQTPYDEIFSVVCYAHRKDPKNTTSVNVDMFTSRQNYTPSAQGSSAGLEGVWATRITLTKQNIDSNYAVKYIMDVFPPAQFTSALTPFVGYFGNIITTVMAVQIPSPKAIAAKLMGMFAAVVQQQIATYAQQAATIQPVVNQIITAANAIAAISKDPTAIIQYLPFIIGLLFQYVPQETIAEIIKEYRGQG
jgi:hypothetical protein